MWTGHGEHGSSSGCAAPGGVTSWPVRTLSIIALTALFLLLVLTPALDGAAANAGRAASQALIVLVVLGRICYARLRAERNRTWIAYLAGLVLLVPAWFVLEGLIRDLSLVR
jgi:hypothetical protein